ncbi:MAG: hypothetical protein KDA57_07490 [Planctomycetales bacterium]|nr:hypothetical protein [Planctomycetales bacterium]
MRFNRALIFGSVAGAAGAAAWAAIAYFANLEIGWLAWGIGLAVGVACVKGAGYGSKLIGTTAAIITLVAILLGKFATIELVMNDEFGDPQALIRESIAALNDETLTSYLADEIIKGMEENGEAVDWPAGVDPTTASTRVEYPANVWIAAEEQWNALTPGENKTFRLRSKRVSKPTSLLTSMRFRTKSEIKAFCKASA